MVRVALPDPFGGGQHDCRHKQPAIFIRPDDRHVSA